MTDSTPDELRAALAVAIGWRVVPAEAGGWSCHRPDGRRVSFGALPDPARDLNAMAAVEAAMWERGLAHSYLARLLLHGAEPAVCIDLTEEAVWDAVTAPAAVRALAAWKVLNP